MQRLPRRDAFRSEAEATQDTFDHLPVVDQHDDAQLARARRVEERMGFPHLLDEFAPRAREDTARRVSGYVNDLDNFAGNLDLLGGALVSLAAHRIRVPAVAANKLEVLIGSLLGDGSTEVTGTEMEKLMFTHIQITDDDLRLLASQRAMKVKDAILKSGKVEPERLFIIEPKSLAPEKRHTLKQSRVDFRIR